MIRFGLKYDSSCGAIPGSDITMVGFPVVRLTLSSCRHDSERPYCESIHGTERLEAQGGNLIGGTPV